jgi:prevent-host-death family protein
MTSRTKPSKSSQSSRRPKRKSGSTKKGRRTRTVALAKVKDDFSRYLKLASREEIVITRHGQPAGVLIGFEDEDAWFDYRVENHPEFLERIQEAREDLRAGRGVRLEEVRD